MKSKQLYYKFFNTVTNADRKPMAQTNEYKKNKIKAKKQ